MSDQPNVPEPSSRIEVLRGRADAETLAAVVVALTPTGGGVGGAPSGPTGWAAGALLEGVGVPAIAQPADLRRIPGVR